ncbi:hypothetical protein J2848_005269 [Azospirillum lipoferum]|uniref:HNH endonuclease n=1 Tax=Azospirillum lipoferum TaxID=193 RepID=A0A5A9GF54_AZOLI|nr:MULTISPECIES: hypothetical protein [Azospirillum]KAA0593168.1 hypothetical protein FZ942_24840 [Azospirillum lipoferum]MCP1613573.1 hypothetical protein [Azospirillum lipoferum]MDW5532336.1 hypothetical protein [Azospirillum sp. NL1]
MGNSKSGTTPLILSIFGKFLYSFYRNRPISEHNLYPAMDPYRSKSWKEFCNEVIRLDGGVCCRCRRGLSDGVILQVHHKAYLLNHKPWEYPYELCETLCRGCHAAEHGKIMPNFGWSLIGYDDLGDLDGTCQLCGTAIRHVFMIQHNKWPTMEVGEVCCDNLTCSDEAGTHMESLRRFNDRQRRFISSSRWTILEEGIESIKQKNYEISIVNVRQKFMIRINEIDGKQRFTSSLEAKKTVFFLLESGKIDEFMKKKRGLLA